MGFKEIASTAANKVGVVPTRTLIAVGSIIGLVVAEVLLVAAKGDREETTINIEADTVIIEDPDAA